MVAGKGNVVIWTESCKVRILVGCLVDRVDGVVVGVVIVVKIGCGKRGRV